MNNCGNQLHRIRLLKLSVRKFTCCAKAIETVIIIQMLKLYFLSFTLFTILLSGCSPKTSENPKEVYRLWSGEKPPKNIKVLNGKYRQSGHFTKEYIMFMELSAPKDWIHGFIVQNNLKPATESMSLPSDAPAWFKPTSAFNVWEPADVSQGSAYYVDSLSGHMMIYEIQL